MDPFFEKQEHYVRVLYKNVSNTAELRKLIFAASLPFSLLNPRLIVDPFQLSVAITKALYNMKEGTMSTRNLQTEIIYCLSPSKNITESLNTFSSRDGDTELLVIGEEKLFPSLQGAIRGVEVPLEDLKNICDVKTIMHVYKISEEELQQSNLLDSVISRMASKDYSNILSSSLSSIEIGKKKSSKPKSPSNQSPAKSLKLS